MFHKIGQLYPAYLFSFAVFYFVCLQPWHFSALQNIQLILNGGSEILLLPMTGIGHFAYNGGSWYLSALLAGSWFYHQLISINRKVTVRLLVPCYVILYYAHRYHVYGFVGPWEGLTGAVSNGLLRGLAAMGVGIITHSTVQCMKDWRPSTLGRMLWTLLEFCMYSTFLAVTTCTGGTRVEFALILGCLPLAVAITFSGISCSGRMFRHPVFHYLGKVSYPIYLNYSVLMFLFAKYFAENGSNWLRTAYLLVTVLFAAFAQAVVSALSRIVKQKIWPRLKVAFLDAERGR